MRSMSAKKVIRAHYKNTFDKETVQAKMKVHYSDAKQSQSLTIKLRMKKDEVIWMSGTFLGMPIAKVMITPTSVQFYEKIKHTYFSGDFSLINKVLGSDLDFKQLQNLLVGEAVFDLREGKYNSQPNQQRYLLTPRKQADLFQIFYWINSNHYKLDQQRIQNEDLEKYLTVSYLEYQKNEAIYFPKKTKIVATENNNTTTIDLDFKSLEFNKKTKFPFSIPEGYKRIEL
jgi:hypothetical protein